MGRRLAAILAADVVGYSSLMAKDDTGTVALLKAHRKQLFDPTVLRHGGRIVKLMGDGTLVEFASALSAVECAIEIQEALSNQDGRFDGAMLLAWWWNASKDLSLRSEYELQRTCL